MDRLTEPRTAPRGTALLPWIGLGTAVILMLLAMVIPFVLNWDVRANSFPPLHAEWQPRLGLGTAPAIILAFIAIKCGVDAAARAPWRLLLLGSVVASAAWLICLALVDGIDGIGQILNTPYEYLNTARSVTDFSATLREYVSRIPLDSPNNWPVHIAGHPPGALLFFTVLVWLGLGSGVAAGFVVILVAATTPAAVLVTLHRLGAEEGARRATPFIVMGPAAIWMAVSADAVFGAYAAWGLCCLTFAATAATRRAMALWGVASGLILGYCVMLSYGLPLLGILACALLALSRNWRPLPWAVLAAVAVVVAFAVTGFVWWEAYPVLVERYWDGIASRRPSSYWLWGNLAALAFSAGPIIGAAVAVGLRGLSPWRTALSRPVVIVTVAAVAMVLAADISGMSKAEVERIWLPFVPWLLVGTALLPERWRRWGFAGQLVVALIVQHTLFTGW
ncbi:MAG: hypothetical protein ACRCSP_03500 [Rhodoglobus sp.]